MRKKMELTTKQRQVIALSYVRSSGTYSKAGKLANVSDVVSRRFLDSDDGHAEIQRAARDHLGRNLVPYCLGILSGLLENPLVKPETKVRVCETLLDRSSLSRRDTVQIEVIDPQQIIADLERTRQDRLKVVSPLDDGLDPPAQALLVSSVGHED